jgi:tRNA-splicing ligase RtcB (3'-phosphate/5'-hydroxy nucleic acid ligase)
MTTDVLMSKPANSRPVDPLEAMCRTLAVEAGLDPDARVQKPGAEKSWPTWCGFRAEAQALRAKENAAAAPLAWEPMPQPDRYRDASLTIAGSHDEGTITQMKNCMSVGNVVAGALCADGHLGYAQPVGAVIAYDGQISISGVGFDIACGNMAVRLDTRYEDIKDRAPQILADIKANIAFGVGRKNDERVEHALFDDADAWRASGMEDYRTKAQGQLGTVGSGNHYVDLFRDDAGFVWIGVHFGSRGLGHSTATKYLKLAGGKDGMHVPPTVVDERSEIGQAYLAGMELAGRYAYAGREWVVERVRKIVGGRASQSVHNHHNYAWREHHFGVDCWVVRKGATPAFPDQMGFIGGSMGESAVIVAGNPMCTEAQANLLFSTVHGAGRNFGRKQALRTFTRPQMDEWLQRAGVLVSGGDLDESPMAYKRLPEVLAHHGDTIQVVATLRPFAVAMAGNDEFDPWKD